MKTRIDYGSREKVLVNDEQVKIVGRNEGRIFLNLDVIPPGKERADAYCVLCWEDIEKIVDWYNGQKGLML